MTEATEQRSPLQSPLFRALWIASLVSNIGTGMHDVGAAWLMTSLSTNALTVSLVQTAATLPLFLFALPAGALADILDRRRLLIAAQLWAVTATLVLAMTAFAGAMTPGLLLLLTLSVSAGAAFSAPALQAVLPELVPRSQLAGAIALSSLSVNIARAVGPAAAGLIILWSGPAVVFALNALSTLAVVVVLARWKRPRAPASLPAERLVGGIRAGIRYTRSSPPLRAIFIRSAGFFLFASALWALLPLIARSELGLGPGGYGLLLAAVGVGAIGGAVARGTLRKHMGLNRVTQIAALLVATAIVAVVAAVWAQSAAAAVAAMLVAGFGWISVLTSLSYAAQTSAPPWVKARVLAFGILVFQGSMAAGSAWWGWIASNIGIEPTLLLAAMGLSVALVLSLRFVVEGGGSIDLDPSHHWATPETEHPVSLERGPVLVLVDYLIEPADRAAFVSAMQAVQHSRRRDGAVTWALFEDVASDTRFTETFLVESWLEHLRQHDRVNHADEAIEELARRFHRGPGRPAVRHMIAAEAAAFIPTYKDGEPT